MYEMVKYILMYVLFVQNVDEIIYHLHVFHGIVQLLIKSNFNIDFDFCNL